MSDENKKIDPKVLESLDGIYASLTDEQKEKAKGCKTVGELTSLLGELGIALPDELLDNVAGGGMQEDLELIYKLERWDEVCKQRGIDVHDNYNRELVWRELYPLG